MITPAIAKLFNKTKAPTVETAVIFDRMTGSAFHVWKTGSKNDPNRSAGRINARAAYLDYCGYCEKHPVNTTGAMCGNCGHNHMPALF